MDKVKREEEAQARETKIRLIIQAWRNGYGDFASNPKNAIAVLAQIEELVKVKRGT